MSELAAIRKMREKTRAEMGEEDYRHRTGSLLAATGFQVFVNGLSAKPEALAGVVGIYDGLIADGTIQGRSLFCCVLLDSLEALADQAVAAS